jgi:hypothetical protein
LTAAERAPGWSSYHFFFHAGRNRLLTGLVRPLVASLFAARAADGFFYLRYDLGGPHIRLRMRCAAPEAVTARVAAAAAAFFASQPSTTPLPAEEIHRRNRAILAEEPGESDAVYPDNSLRMLPFVPETSRYGGPVLIERSLDFFGLSSWQALEIIAMCGAKPWGQQLPHLFLELAQLASGLATSEEELLGLLGYSAVEAESTLAPVAARADRLFAEHRELFCQLMQAAVETPAGALPERPCGAPALAYAEAISCLSREIGFADLPARWLILTSHMHMTANRLGLENWDEVYVGRLLWRAARDLSDYNRAFRDCLAVRFTSRSGAAPPAPTLSGIRDLLYRAIAAIASEVAGCQSADRSPKNQALQEEAG